MERLFLGLYWYNRMETIQSTADRLCDVVQEIAGTDDRYKVLKLASDAKLENRYIDFDRSAPVVAAELANALLLDRTKDIKKYHPGVAPSVAFQEPTGFAVAFEVKLIKKMQITGIIGGYGAGAINNLLLKFPADFSYDFNYVYTIFMGLVRVLQPDWGVALTRPFEALITQSLPDIKVGWFNYFSYKINVEGLQEKVNTEDQAAGTLTFTTNKGENFSSDNKAHVANALFVIDFLKKKALTTQSFI